MRLTPAIAAALVVATASFAASKAWETRPGAAPSADTDGVSLGVAQGCRCSIRVDAGTDAVNRRGFAPSGWTMYTWYQDPVLGWTESASSLRCSPNARLDAGFIFNFACPDMEPLASFGRIACATVGPTGHDGGTGADSIEDAGTGPQPIVRTECWGPSVISN